MTDICCIFNFYAFYREPIYKLMDDQIGCDFYFGDSYGLKLKKADYDALKGYKGTLKVTFGLFHRFKGAHKAVMNKQYRKYIAIGDPYCLSIWWLLIWARLTGKKTVLWTHGWYRDGKWVQNLLNAIFWRLPNHIMTYGNYARDFMISKGIKPEKMTPIYNSLDYDRQLEIRKQLDDTDIYKRHFNNDYPILLYIGRLQKRKKINRVVEAMALLRDRGVDTNFVVIGEAAEDIGLEEYVNNYNMNDRVWIYGPCYDEKTKGELMFNADLCVTPGNVGLTAMDCLMYGLPIATSNNFSTQMPEFEAIENGKTGTFFDVNDLNDMVDKIEIWLKNHSRETHNKIASDCYKVIDDKWNPHYQIKVIKNILNNL